MFEIGREENPGEFRRVPNDEAGVIRAPRDDIVCHRIVHHVIRLLNKRRRISSVSAAVE